MTRNMKPELLALSTGLIACVYGAGYRLTTPATVLGHTVASVTPAQHARLGRYRNGTYSATGISDLGTVSVSVTIDRGTIAKVEITDCSMHYPQWYIDGLPAEVLAAQSATIDWVSGASYSSYSFASAVAQALAQASGPSTASPSTLPTVVPAGWSP
jgi:uncharacterized protein with FMN-binding domain